MSKYLEKVRQLPCCVCEKFGLHQTTPTTAHHPICFRFSTKKVPDNMAIPLCDCHHQGLWGKSKGKLAIHKNKSAWVDSYGLDTDYIEATRAAIEQRELFSVGQKNVMAAQKA